jgi:hypothetical protein
MIAMAIIHAITATVTLLAAIFCEKTEHATKLSRENGGGSRRDVWPDERKLRAAGKILISLAAVREAWTLEGFDNGPDVPLRYPKLALILHLPVVHPIVE